MRRVLLIFTTLLLCGTAGAQGKSHRKSPTPPREPEVVVVDDESCGCELYFYDGIQTTYRDSLFGFKLADGTELVSPRYKFVDHWHGDYCIVLSDYDRYGLINRQGQELVPTIYEDVIYPTDSMIRVMQHGLYGYLRADGSKAVAPQYRAASGFSEGLAVVTVASDSGRLVYTFVDHDGHQVFDATYDYAYPFQNGYAVVKRDERYGIIDRRGSVVVPIRHESVTGVDPNGLFAVFDPAVQKFAMFNTRGRQITPYLYDAISGYGDGYYLFQRDGRYGYFNVHGHERFGLYESANAFVDGLAMVARDGRYGIIDTRGREVLPIAYDNSYTSPDNYFFHDGLAVVEKDHLFGYCDTKGNIVIPPQYQNCFRFTDGRAPVKKDYGWGYIDTEGDFVVPPIFDYASPFQYGRADVVHKSHSYKINVDGRCVKNCYKFPEY